MKSRLLFRLWLLAWLAAWWPQPVPAQGTFYSLFTNGPTAKRLNVVVLAEGYTTNQVSDFLYAATNAVNSLLAQQPHLEYKNYFNAYAIFVASAEAGSDQPISGGTLKNTYFNSTFDSYGIWQLLTIPPNNYNGNYSQGQGKVDALLAALMPEYDLAVMVVNHPDYGGSGGITLITSVHPLGPEIIVHESGHTLAGLTDEYTTPFPSVTPVEKPNATAITSSNLIKWKVWIPGGTLIPTPEHTTNATRVGLFQGAQYQTTGWYRPKLDCKMRTIGNFELVPFCEVCTEQLVKSIYARLRPIDSFTPMAANLTLYSTQAVTFSVATLQPLTHNLSVQWFTNNVAVTGASNPTFTLSPVALGNGSRTVKAVVNDATDMVRNDPTGLLRQTNTWNLTISLSELALVSARYLNANRFRFTVTGSAPAGFVIQASTNLLNWTALSTNTLTGGRYDFTNSNLTNLTPPYYRTVSPP